MCERGLVNRSVSRAVVFEAAIFPLFLAPDVHQLLSAS
jgi:hypothetical protein